MKKIGFYVILIARLSELVFFQDSRPENSSLYFSKTWPLYLVYEKTLTWYCAKKKNICTQNQRSALSKHGRVIFSIFITRDTFSPSLFRSINQFVVIETRRQYFFPHRQLFTFIELPSPSEIRLKYISPLRMIRRDRVSTILSCHFPIRNNVVRIIKIKYFMPTNAFYGISWLTKNGAARGWRCHEKKRNKIVGRGSKFTSFKSNYERIRRASSSTLFTSNVLCTDRLSPRKTGGSKLLHDLALLYFLVFRFSVYAAQRKMIVTMQRNEQPGYMISTAFETSTKEI